MRAGMPYQQLVDDFLASRAAARRSPRTLAWYRYILTQLIEANDGQLPTTPEQIERWLATSRTSSYQRSRLSAVKAFYTWAVSRGRIKRKRNPVRTLSAAKPRSLPRTFTESELRAILAAARESHPMDYAAVVTLLDTGIRIGELASLTTGRIGRGELLVVGKTGERTVPISAPARAELMRLALPDPRSPIFRNLNPHGQLTNTPMTADRLGKRVRRVVIDAGLTGKRLGPHTFRHTFATEFLRRGGNVYALKAILGHSSVTTTEIYLHLVRDDIAAAHTRSTPLTELLRPQQWGLLEPVVRTTDDRAAI